jgi:phosphatidylglycerophosphate synthase
MREGATPGKLPEAAAFVDLSDYARPFAVRVARRLAPTRVRAPHVTVAWAVLGLAGAGAYAAGGYGAALAGAALLQTKNILDAVDGSLARLQGRPSRIGRFLDSLCDALVAAALYGALAVAVARVRPAGYAAALGTAALVLGLLQSSVFNYYYVRYRARRGGDATSRVEERYTGEDAARYRGRPLAGALLRGLLWAYAWVYGWQDVLVRRFDRWAAAPLTAVGRGDLAESLRDDRAFLTAVSALGPGLQILLLDAYTVAGWRRLEPALELFLVTVALGGTAYAAALFLRLRRVARRCARAGPGSG